MDDYRKIVGEAAARKIIVLSKGFLEIIEELENEDEEKIEKFRAAAEKMGVTSELEVLIPFLYLIDKNKKETIRKRIFDQANALVRELQQ